RSPRGVQGTVPPAAAAGRPPPRPPAPPQRPASLAGRGPRKPARRGRPPARRREARAPGGGVMATARVLRLPQTQPRRDDGRRARHLRLIPGGAGLRPTPRAGAVLTVLASVRLSAVARCHSLRIARPPGRPECGAEGAGPR